MTSSELSKRVPARLLRLLALGFDPLVLGGAIRLLDRSNRAALVVSVTSVLIIAAMYPVFLLVLRWLLQLMQQQWGATAGGLAGDVGAATVALLVALLFSRLAAVARDASAAILRQESWVVVTKAMMEKLAGVPYPAFENNDFQARYGLVVREGAFRLSVLVESLLTTAIAALSLVVLAATVLSLAPVLVITVLLVSVPAILVEARFSKAAVDLQSGSAPGLLRMQYLSTLQIDAACQRDLRVYRSGVLADEYAALADGYLHNLKRLTWRYQGLRMLAASVEMVGVGLALVATFVLLAWRQLSLVEVGVLIPGLYLLVSNGQALSYHYRALGEALAYSAKVTEFLRAPVTTLPGLALVAPVGEVAASPIETAQLTSVVLDAVSYVYPETQKQALSTVSCAFTVGMTAVVGPNGAGKSTLVKLVTGLVDPTSGSVVASTSAGQRVSVARLSKAVLFQDPSHLHLTIRQNVTMRRDRAPYEEAGVRSALQAAGLERFVAGLPDGIDTVVGPGFGGFTDLSGGQWQRLALARLIFHEAPLIILDEPSASLDPQGEQSIFELAASLAQERIVIFTTHRYDTVQRAHTVIVLVDGEVAEIGTPAELTERARAYWSLFKGQAHREEAVRVAARSEYRRQSLSSEEEPR